MIISVLGDSLSCGYLAGGTFVHDVQSSYPALVANAIATGATVRVAAQPGWYISDAVRAVSALPSASDAALHRDPVCDVISRWDTLLAAARQHMPGARIVVVGLRDYTVTAWRESNARVRKLTAIFNAHVLSRPDTIGVDLINRPDTYALEFFPDSVHPSPAGVRWLGRAIAEALLPITQLK